MQKYETFAFVWKFRLSNYCKVQQWLPSDTVKKNFNEDVVLAVWQFRAWSQCMDGPVCLRLPVNIVRFPSLVLTFENHHDTGKYCYWVCCHRASLEDDEAWVTQGEQPRHIRAGWELHLSVCVLYPQLCCSPQAAAVWGFITSARWERNRKPCFVEVQHIQCIVSKHVMWERQKKWGCNVAVVWHHKNKCKNPGPRLQNGILKPSKRILESPHRPTVAAWVWWGQMFFNGTVCIETWSTGAEASL